MNRQELVTELAKRYGGGKFYSKHFTDHPPAEIFFHNKTGFSIGMWRKDTQQAHLFDDGELQQSYRIDIAKEGAKP